VWAISPSEAYAVGTDDQDRAVVLHKKMVP
jgi:hypothetical protein